MTKTTERFECVDALRGVCALLVAMLHCQTYSHVAGVRFFDNAYLFVDFFFVLSGFVIASNYADRLRDGYAIQRFAMLRFGRVYPLYLLTLLMFVGMELLQVLIPALGAMGANPPFSAPRQSLDTVIANLLLLQSFGVYDFLTWNTPGWSIATEFWTYLLFACLARWAWSYRIGILATTMIAGIVLVGMLSPKYMNTAYDYGFVRTLAGFSAGALSFELWRSKLRGAPILARSSTGVEVLALLSTVLFVTMADQGPLSLLAPFVFSAGVLVFVAERGAISSILKRSEFQFLGALSYSIYMVHLFVGTYLTNVGKLLQAKLGIPLLSTITHNGQEMRVLGTTRLEGDLWLFLTMALIVGLSVLTYRWIEVPWRERFRKAAAGAARPAGHEGLARAHG